MSGVEVAATILRRVLAVPLRNIQWRRTRCPVQLIFDLTNSDRTLQERREPSYECNRFSIDFQSFMVEPGTVAWVIRSSLNSTGSYPENARTVTLVRQEDFEGGASWKVRISDSFVPCLLIRLTVVEAFPRKTRGVIAISGFCNSRVIRFTGPETSPQAA